MIDTINKAERYAANAHRGQVRANGDPYIVHPARVAGILGKVTNGQDINLIAAAWLHDVLEDCGVEYAHLYVDFGADIADLVREVTHAGTDDHIGYYFPLLKSRRAMLLKFADRLDNLSDMQGWEPDKINHYMNKSKFWKESRK
jgi:GTP diphosphokinase / guanosine-3',5'-bis(diphosphate) 3'-diphosphatase